MMVEIYYPSILHGRPDKAKANAYARITRTQIIIESGTITFDRDSAARIGTPLFVRKEGLRFRRKDGRPIPHFVMCGGWRISRAELDRIDRAEQASIADEQRRIAG